MPRIKHLSLVKSLGQHSDSEPVNRLYRKNAANKINIFKDEISTAYLQELQEEFGEWIQFNLEE